METVSCLSLFFFNSKLASFLPAVSGFLPVWWLTFPRCEMQMWEVGSFPCLSRGFSESMVLLSFLINLTLLIQMVFLLATVFWGLLQYLISHVLECSLYMHLKLGWLWEFLEDHTKLLNLVCWHRQIPPSPLHFRVYLVKLSCLTTSSSFDRGVFGACSGNLLASAQLGSWWYRAVCCLSVVTVPAPLCSVLICWHCNGLCGPTWNHMHYSYAFHKVLGYLDW